MAEQTGESLEVQPSEAGRRLDDGRVAGCG